MPPRMGNLRALASRAVEASRRGSPRRSPRHRSPPALSATAGPGRNPGAHMTRSTGRQSPVTSQEPDRGQPGMPRMIVMHGLTEWRSAAASRPDRRFYVRALTIDRPRSVIAGVLQPGSAARSSRVGRPVAASATALGVSAAGYREGRPGAWGWARRWCPVKTWLRLPGRQAMVRWQIWRRVTGQRVTVPGTRRELELLIRSGDTQARRGDLAVCRTAPVRAAGLPGG